MPRSSLTVFHGSFNGDIETFRPFTHFGARDAALAALSAKLLDGKAKEGDQAFLYEVQLTFDSEQVLRLDDWGTPTPLGLLTELESKSIESFPESVTVPIRLATNGKTKEEARELCSAGLLKAFAARHVVLLEYKNRVENVEKKSYCIVDNGIIARSTRSDVTEKELREGIEHLSDFRKPQISVSK